MKGFNAFQCVVFYAAAPFGIAWLSGQTFPWHTAAMVCSVIMYLIYTGFMTNAVLTAFEDWDK